MEPDAVQTKNKPLEARSSFLTQPKENISQPMIFAGHVKVNQLPD